jgi:AraC-like DNA-binding protein
MFAPAKSLVCACHNRRVPRPPAPAAASSRLVPRVLRHVRERGGDADALIRRFALPPDIEAQAEAAISPTDFEPLMEAASTTLADPCLAVHLVEALEWPSYSIPELAARASPTLREALERVARYASLFYAHLVITCAPKGGELVFTHRVRGAPAAALRHSNEYALASALHHARRLTERQLVPSRVWFAHGRPPEVAELQRFFGAPRISFDRPESGFAFAAEVAALPTRTEDARLLATAEALAERALRDSPPAADFAGTVARRMEEALAKGTVDLATIARQLRLSPRTLHRRLLAEGTGFKALLEIVRRDLARAWVEKGSLPLAEIAFRLGYSDAAAFSRAFKRWTGRSPGAYRGAAPDGPC